MQSIKADLALSDIQLGFLTGIAFAFFYAVLGIPIARWADKGNRIKIIYVTTGLWGIAVATCGLATGFVQLLIARIFVGVGEAGSIPPANSLIADMFERRERPRATSRYMLGGSIGVVAAFFIAGWLNQLYGWRAVFYLMGGCGLATAIAAGLFLNEPRELGPEYSPPSRGLQSPVVSLTEVFRAVFSNRTWLNLTMSTSLVYFFGSGLSTWQPAFFIRVYGMKTGELGTWFSAIFGLTAVAGTYAGGELATRFAGGDERLQLKTMAVAYCIFGFISAMAFVVSNKYAAFALLAIGGVTINVTTGPILAIIQSVIPSRMRAIAISLVYFFANLVGLGLGPLVTGALSEFFERRFGSESLRYALLCMYPGYAWCAFHFWRASRSVARDLLKNGERLL